MAIFGHFQKILNTYIEGATRKPVKSIFGHFELRTYLKSAYQNTHSVRFSDQTEHFKRFWKINFLSFEKKVPRENLLSPAVPRENLLSPQSQNNFFRINVGKIDFDERNLAIIIKIPIPFYFSHILVYNYLQTWESGLNMFSRGTLISECATRKPVKSEFANISINISYMINHLHLDHKKWWNLPLFFYRGLKLD